MYSFSGVVIHGNKRGKPMGFPTANIALTKQIPEGIYLSYAAFENRKLPSLTFIGSPKTFNEMNYKAEVYILDFDEDLYDKELSVELLMKLRNNKRFDSVDDLVSQMEKDKQMAKEYFSSLSPRTAR